MVCKDSDGAHVWTVQYTTQMEKIKDNGGKDLRSPSQASLPVYTSCSGMLTRRVAVSNSPHMRVAVQLFFKARYRCLKTLVTLPKAIVMNMLIYRHTKEIRFEYVFHPSGRGDNR